MSRKKARSLYEIYEATDDSYVLQNAKIYEQSFRIVTGVKRKGLFIGIDPGQRNMGLCFLKENFVVAYEINLPKAGDAVERIVITKDITSLLLERFIGPYHPKAACVEYASFGAPFGQVALSEARVAAVISLLPFVWPKVVPPASIRKEVFGDGRLKAHEVWTDLKPDLAAAVSCAIYALRRISEVR